MSNRKIEIAWSVDDSGCWIVTSHKTGTHGYVHLWRDGKRCQAHRFMYKQRNGSIPEGAYILHSCDVRACVNPDHLRAGTQADNMQDMAERGRSTRGERNAAAKLTVSQVRDIRADTTSSHGQLARKYGVGVTTIAHVRHRRTWRHIN